MKTSLHITSIFLLLGLNAFAFAYLPPHGYDSVDTRLVAREFDLDEGCSESIQSLYARESSPQDLVDYLNFLDSSSVKLRRRLTRRDQERRYKLYIRTLLGDNLPPVDKNYKPQSDKAWLDAKKAEQDKKTVSHGTKEQQGAFAKYDDKSKMANAANAKVEQMLADKEKNAGARKSHADSRREKQADNKVLKAQGKAMQQQNDAHNERFGLGIDKVNDAQFSKSLEKEQKKIDAMPPGPKKDEAQKKLNAGKGHLSKAGVNFVDGKKERGELYKQMHATGFQTNKERKKEDKLVEKKGPMLVKGGTTKSFDNQQSDRSVRKLNPWM